MLEAAFIQLKTGLPPDYNVDMQLIPLRCHKDPSVYQVV
jgi:hypothetical protein